MSVSRLMDQVRNVLRVYHYSLRDLHPKNNTTVGFALPFRQ